jgi:hypothetical protein
VPAATNVSAGHAADVPVHASVTSHVPAAARQVVPAATNVSAGQPAAVPVHVSATSHAPTDARHWVAALANPSVGHVVATPSHVSAMSQMPATARQTVPAEVTPGVHVPARQTELQVPSTQSASVTHASARRGSSNASRDTARAVRLSSAVARSVIREDPGLVFTISSLRTRERGGGPRS